MVCLWGVACGVVVWCMFCVGLIVGVEAGY